MYKKGNNNKRKTLKKNKVSYNTIYVNEKHKPHGMFYNTYIHTFKGIC